MGETTTYFVNFSFEHTTGPNAGQPAYAGNIDSKMYGFITGFDDDRYGCARGIALHEAVVSDLFEEDADYIVWDDVVSDHGMVPYCLCPPDNNAMQMKLNFYGMDDDQEVYMRLRRLADRVLGFDVLGHKIVAVNIVKEVTKADNIYTMKEL